MLVEHYLTRQLTQWPESIRGSVHDQDAIRQLANLERLVFTSLSLFYDGPPRLSQYFAVEDQRLATKQRVLQIAGSLATGATVPSLQSIVRAAHENDLPLREIETDQIGEYGLTGKLERTWYVLGDEEVMRSEGIELGATSRALMHQLEATGKQITFLAQKQPKRLLAVFADDFQVLPSAPEIVQRLHDMGLELMILTGQKGRIAKGITDRLNIKLVHTDLQSTEKSQLTLTLQEHLPITAFVCTPETWRAQQNIKLPIVVSVRGAKAASTVKNIADIPELIQQSHTTLEKTRKRFFWCKL